MTDPGRGRPPHRTARARPRRSYRPTRSIARSTRDLVRQRLKDTLAIAMHAVERISAGFDGNVARMADDSQWGRAAMMD